MYGKVLLAIWFPMTCSNMADSVVINNSFNLHLWVAWSSGRTLDSVSEVPGSNPTKQRILSKWIPLPPLDLALSNVETNLGLKPRGEKSFLHLKSVHYVLFAYYKTVAVVIVVIMLLLLLFRAGCPVGPGFTLSKVYTVTPTLQSNKDKRGLALDGQLKHEDTNLASSTMWVVT